MNEITERAIADKKEVCHSYIQVDLSLGVCGVNLLRHFFFVG